MKQTTDRFGTSAIPENITASPVVFVLDHEMPEGSPFEQSIRAAGWHSRRLASGEELFSCPRAPTPSCLVLDVTLPDFNSVEFQGRLARESDLPIIFVATVGDVPIAVQIVKAEAVEFLTKPYDSDTLLNAVRRALEWSKASLDRQAQLRILKHRYSALTLREHQILAFVISGFLNKQIASELGISEVTVKAHRGKMMRKMRASSLPELVRMALKLGVIPTFNNDRVPVVDRFVDLARTRGWDRTAPAYAPA